MKLLQCDRFWIQSNLNLLGDIQERFQQFCQQHGQDFPWLKDQSPALNLALAEGFTNAVRHAHRGLPAETPIEIAVSLWNDTCNPALRDTLRLRACTCQHIEIRIWDQGNPFDPDTLEEPKPGTLRQGGYGWFLLRRIADQVVYERHPNNRNCLLIVKYWKTKVEQNRAY